MENQDEKIKSEISAENGRDKNGRFAEGNPGRPKGSGLNLTSLLKSKLEEIPKGAKEAYKDKFIKKLLDKALVENDIQALKLIINYCDGLPRQIIDGKIEVTNFKKLLEDIENE